MAASSLARSWLSTAEDNTVALSMSIESLSHEACFNEAGCWGQDWFTCVDNHSVRVTSTAKSDGALHLRRVMSWRSRVLAADAKKAEGASAAARRIPRPPSLTGRLACIHCVSDKLEFVIALMPECKSLSNVAREEWSVHPSLFPLHRSFCPCHFRQTPTLWYQRDHQH